MAIRKIDHTTQKNSITPLKPEIKAKPSSFGKIIHNSMNGNPHKPLKDYSFKQLRQPDLSFVKEIIKNPIHSFLATINSRLNNEEIEIISNILRGDIAHHSGKLPEELNSGDFERYFK